MIGNLGVADIDSRLEEQIIDGIVYAFQDLKHLQNMALKQDKYP